MDKKQPVEEIIISGGGTNYIAMLGALHHLHISEKLAGVKRYIGTSIGAVLCFLLALGYDPLTIMEVSLRYNFSTLNDITTDDVLSIFDNLGVTTGEKIINIINIFMKNKDFPSDITFDQLKVLTQKELLVTTWCVDDQRTVVFSHETHPHIQILTAIHMSISVPFIFRPVKFEGKMYVDGGIYDNLPVSFSQCPETTLCITTESQHRSQATGMDLIEYFHIVMRSIVGEMGRIKVSNSPVKNILTIHIPYSPIINTQMNNSKKKYLFELGIAEAKKMFKFK
jgi:predicted acylesterase/phospholipase RssA